MVDLDLSRFISISITILDGIILFYTRPHVLAIVFKCKKFNILILWISRPREVGANFGKIALSNHCHPKVQNRIFITSPFSNLIAVLMN